MAAVGIFSIQRVNRSGILPWLRIPDRYLSPYILMTSQFQSWDMFSPDPTRRLKEIRIETMQNGTWSLSRLVDGKHLGSFKRAPELKYLDMIQAYPSLKPLEEPYIQDVCRSDHLKPGTPIRMRIRRAVLPMPEDRNSIDAWRQWRPEWSEWIDHTTSCTPISS